MAPRDERPDDKLLDAELEQTFPASDPLPFTHDAPRHLVYLEDLAVGQTFSTHAIVVHEDEVRAFASQFDPQPFHLDEAAARASIFGRLAASGWHTASMTMRLIVDAGLPIAGGLIGLGGDIQWPRPTYPGDSIHVEGEVLEIVPSRSKPLGIVTVKQRTVNQRGEDVQIVTMKLRVPRRPPPVG
jgi:acyl dehydratase